MPGLYLRVECKEHAISHQRRTIWMVQKIVAAEFVRKEWVEWDNVRLRADA